MASNQLIVLEQQLKPLEQPLAEVLAGRMPVERLTRTLLISCERNPKLLECDRQSLFNSAMSAAVLGLEVDGVTGQAFLIPFKNRAQLVIGYRGFTTMGARSGYTITGAVVREGDQFNFSLGTEPVLIHIPADKPGGRITHAWAAATNLRLPPIISVLPIADILAIKQKSPGARKEDSPWNDPAIGFPAMAEKSAKRRLARSMPLNVMQYAARLEEAFDEQGRHSWIDPNKGVQIEGNLVDVQPDTSTAVASEAQAQPDPPASTPVHDAGGPLSLEDQARAEAKKGERKFVEWFKRCSYVEKERIQRMSGELRDLMNEADLGAA